MRVLKDLKARYTFVMDMEVRDYELDSEQIVNNANYLHYMEHTRHCFCREAGTSFGKLREMGIDVVVRKVEVEYKDSLRCGDTFISALRMERRGARFIFHQDILRADGTVCARGVVTVVALVDGKVSRGDSLAALFEKYIG